MDMTFNYSEFHTDHIIRETLTFVQAPVTGERSLADRFADQLEIEFLSRIDPFFVTPEIYNSLDKDLQRKIYRAAIMNAAAVSVGTNDVILTPTGLGVVSTSSVAPASTARRDELVRSLIQSSDNLIMATLREIAKAPGWLDSEPGRFWSASPVHSLDIGKSFRDFLKVYPDYKDQFLQLQRHVIGRPLADALRTADFMADSPTWLVSLQALVCDYIRKIVAAEEKSSTTLCVHRDLAAHLKELPQALDLWSAGEPFRHWSEAPLHRYKNRRDSSGFFF